MVLTGGDTRPHMRTQACTCLLTAPRTVQLILRGLIPGRVERGLDLGARPTGWVFFRRCGCHSLEAVVGGGKNRCVVGWVPGLGTSPGPAVGLLIGPLGAG